MNGGDYMSFTTTELILLILIVLIVLIVFVILVRNEIKEYLSSKNTKLVTEEDEVVNKKVIRKETINLDDNYVKEKEEVVLPKPSKSSIIIEEEDEYFDPLFDEEDLDLTQSINLKEELHINDVKHHEDVKEDLDKVQYVIDLEDKKDKDHLNNYEDTITSFELEQEENAIISLDELSKISDRIYDENEPVQYDDTDAPISIDEIMNKFNDVKEPEVEPVTVTTKDVIDESDLDTFVEEEEEDFLTDLSRAHRRMSNR